MVLHQLDGEVVSGMKKYPGSELAKKQGEPSGKSQDANVEWGFFQLNCFLQLNCD
jgi:hypothetical protein